MIDKAIRKKFIEILSKKKFLKYIEVDINNDIAEVYLNNPPHNHFSLELLEELLLLYNLFFLVQKAEKFKIGGIIISGKPRRVFSAGASLNMLSEMKEKKAQMKTASLLKKLFEILENSTIPIIAAINGICLGGGLELALACHFRICGKRVYLGFPEIKQGIMPGAGGTQYLPRLIGRSKAQYLILSGKLIPAEEALRMGIVDMVVERDKVMPAARGITKDICDKDEKATEYIIKAISTGLNSSREQGQNLERQFFWELINDRLSEGRLSDENIGIRFVKKIESQ